MLVLFVHPDRILFHAPPAATAAAPEQDILKAAANERGEWDLPLSAEKQGAMRQVRRAGLGLGGAGDSGGGRQPRFEGCWASRCTPTVLAWPAAAPPLPSTTLPNSIPARTLLIQVMDANVDRLDEALLSNAFAWLRKASEDKLDGARSRAAAS